MIVECDFCDVVARGPPEKLSGAGWSQVVITSPGQATVTACPEHHDELIVRLDALLASFKRMEQEGP